MDDAVQQAHAATHTAIAVRTVGSETATPSPDVYEAVPQFRKPKQRTDDQPRDPCAECPAVGHYL